MIELICDICKKRIDGSYKKVLNDNTGTLVLDGYRMDVCNRCWNAFLRCRPIELIDFPNKED